MSSTTPRPIEVIPSTLNEMERPFASDLMGDAPPDDMMLPGVTLIGRGFDIINGNFATSSSALDQLFDIKDRIGPKDTDFPERANAYADCERLFGRDTYGLVEVEPTRGGEASMYTWAGSQVSSVQSKANASAKVEASYGTFSGELEAMGSSSHASSASSHFCHMLGRFPKYVLRLKPRDDNLWNLLLPKVQDALTNWSADKLKSDFFPKYGGYYLHNTVMGGSVKYWAVRTKSSSESSKSFEANMKASYKYGVGEAKGEAHASHAKTNKSFQSNSENGILARGGIKFPDFGTEGAVNAWIETILDAPELIDFHNDTGNYGCRTVWSLIEDNARAKLVSDAFSEYAKANGKVFDGYDPDLVTLYGYKDWKTYDLRRWFYSRNSDHKRTKNWGRHGKQPLKVYDTPRVNCSKFISVSKEISWGRLLGKKHELIYKIVKDKVPKGWTKVSTFYAPTKALTGSLDKWVGVFEFTRDVHGDRCGKSYYKEGFDPGNWKRSKNPKFYTVK